MLSATHSAIKLVTIAVRLGFMKCGQGFSPSAFAALFSVHVKKEYLQTVTQLLEAYP